jgi:hypothetical protein
MRERSRRDLLKGGVGIAPGVIGAGVTVAPAADASAGFALTLDGHQPGYSHQLTMGRGRGAGLAQAGALAAQKPACRTPEYLGS